MRFRCSHLSEPCDSFAGILTSDRFEHCIDSLHDRAVLKTAGNFVEYGVLPATAPTTTGITVVSPRTV